MDLYKSTILTITIICTAILAYQPKADIANMYALINAAGLEPVDVFANIPPKIIHGPTQKYELNNVDTEPDFIITKEQGVAPQILTQNEARGASYVVKTFCYGDYSELYTCFLNDIDRVIVTGPYGGMVELNKDFYKQEYSGEELRRFVLYGKPGWGYPDPGKYVFTYLKGEETKMTQIVNYTHRQIVEIPKDIRWSREADDFLVTWTPGSGDIGWYKVIVYPAGGEIVSKWLPPDAVSARLENLPVADGERFKFGVYPYAKGGYAIPELQRITW